MTAVLIMVTVARMLVIALPIAGGAISIFFFPKHRLLSILGLIVCIALEAQHILLYRVYISTYNPDSASHIEVGLYFLAALCETLFVFMALFGVIRVCLWRADRNQRNHVTA